MNVGIDFDGTLKRSSEVCPNEVAMWRKIIGAFRDAGHTCYITTARGGDWQNEDLRGYQDTLDLGLPVIYSDRSPKREACSKAGVQIDVWIDDMPGAIG